MNKLEVDNTNNHPKIGLGESTKPTSGGYHDRMEMCYQDEFKVQTWKFWSAKAKLYRAFLVLFNAIQKERHDAYWVNAFNKALKSTQ